MLCKASSQIQPKINVWLLTMHQALISRRFRCNIWLLQRVPCSGLPLRASCTPLMRIFETAAIDKESQHPPAHQRRVISLRNPMAMAGDSYDRACARGTFW
jgi:hypothetical protein